MKIVLRFLILFIVIFIMPSFVMPVLAFGIGGGPSRIYFDKVLRSGYSTEKISVSNPNNVSTDIVVTVDGIIKDWVSFEHELRIKANTFTVSADTRYEFYAIVEPPTDIAVGNYTGSILVSSYPQVNLTPVGHGLTILPGFQIDVNVEITGEQILEYVFDGASATDVEEGFPIKFTVGGENKGNVRVRPSVKVDILDRDFTRIVLSRNFTLDEILPTRTGASTFEIPSTGLSIGQYWANLTVFLGDRIIGRSLLTFDVFEKGTLRVKGRLVRIDNKAWVNVGEIVRFDVVFENTGEVSVLAKFKGEIKLDENIVDIMESDEISVGAGETVNLTMYFRPNAEGKYVLDGRVYYSKKITYPNGAIVNVVPVQFAFAPDERMIIIMVIIVAFLLVLKIKILPMHKKPDVYYRSVSRKYGEINRNLDRFEKKEERLMRDVRRLKRR